MKTWIMVLALAFGFGLAGCGGDKTDKTDKSDKSGEGEKKDDGKVGGKTQAEWAKELEAGASDRDKLKAAGEAIKPAGDKGIDMLLAIIKSDGPMKARLGAARVLGGKVLDADKLKGKLDDIKKAHEAEKDPTVKKGLASAVMIIGK